MTCYLVANLLLTGWMLTCCIVSVRPSLEREGRREGGIEGERERKRERERERALPGVQSVILD